MFCDKHTQRRNHKELGFRFGQQVVGLTLSISLKPTTSGINYSDRFLSPILIFAESYISYRHVTFPLILMAASTIDPSEIARRKTALAFVESFTTLSAAACLRVRTPGCLHHFRPRSLNIEPKSSAEFAAHRKNFDGIIASFPFTITELIDNPAANQVLIWTTASPVWNAEVTTSFRKCYHDGGDSERVDWSYTGEYMFLLTFEDGENGDDGEGGKLRRIERIVEFLDSKGTTRLLRLMQDAKKNLATLGTVEQGDALP